MRACHSVASRPASRLASLRTVQNMRNDLAELFEIEENLAGAEMSRPQGLESGLKIAVISSENSSGSW